MGLIQATLGATLGTLSDTWKDYFVCDALDNDTLLVRGMKKGSSSTSDVITNGSGIVVNEGQCALIVEEGNIREVAAEPGNYTFDTSVSPSVFDGGFAGIKDTFKEMIGRFTYGGIANKNQRVYFVNTKEIMGNLYGTATPIPFRIVDKNIGLDTDISIRCNGEYSFRITNPLIFFKNISGNERLRYEKSELISMMKAEMLTALQPAFAKISALGVRYSEVIAHTDDLTIALKEALDQKWTEKRGISFENIAINSVSIDPKDEERINTLQMAAVNKDPLMAAATQTSAINQAMVDAANNANGTMNGFVGVNMMQNVANNTAQLYQQASQAKVVTGNEWTCECGSVNNGNFCPNCGKAKPQAAFCPNCGKPVSAESMFCSNCGTKLR